MLGSCTRLLIIHRDLLHFVANHTADGLLYLGNANAVEYLHQHGNALIISLFEENVHLESAIHE